jgi:hypothetical protein
MHRRSLLLGAGALAAAPALAPNGAHAQGGADRGTLRVAMTVADVPLTTGSRARGRRATASSGSPSTTRSSPGT